MMSPLDFTLDLWSRRKRVFFLTIHALMFFLMVCPGLAILVVSFFKLVPATKGPTVYPNDGVILVGQVGSTAVDQDEITIRWAIGGWGNDYAEPENIFDSKLFPGFPHLQRAANVYFDGELVKAYDPSQVLNRTLSGSNSTQFTTQHSLNGYRDLTTLRAIVATRYFVQVETRVVDPETNESLPMAELSCNREGPSLTGWVVKTWFTQQFSTTRIELPNSPTYVIYIGVDVNDWKLVYEIAMAVMIFSASVVAFFATSISVFLVWIRDKQLSVSDLLAMPLAVGATISALRAAFPPNTEVEIFLDEAVYYPSLVLSVSCAIVAVGLTRSSFVRWQKRMRRWSMGNSGYYDVGSESASLVQHHDVERGVTGVFGSSTRENSEVLPEQREDSYALQRFEARKDSGTITTVTSSL